MLETYLLTGSRGFLGKSLSRELSKTGAVLPVVHEAWDQLPDIIKKYAPHAIFHFAAYGNHYHQKETWKTIEANVVKLEKLFEAVVKSGQKPTIVLCGSSSEYGRKDEPMNENDSCHPEGVYAISKLAATEMGRAFSRHENIKLAIVRPFSVYGEEEADHRFIPTVIDRLKSGEPLQLSPGVHDWIHVEDFTRGVIKVYNHRNDWEAGEIVNIGTGIETSNQEIVEIVEKIAKKRINIQNVPPRPSDPKHWVADNSKLRSWGWKPKITLEKGIKRVYEHRS